MHFGAVHPQAGTPDFRPVAAEIHVGAMHAARLTAAAAPTLAGLGARMSALDSSLASGAALSEIAEAAGTVKVGGRQLVARMGVTPGPSLG